MDPNTPLFELLPRYESVQEVAEDLAPKIMQLQSNLKTMEQFHKLEHLHSVAITQSMIQSIMKSLPMEVKSSFNEQFNSFKRQNPDHILAPNTFSFLAQFIIELKGNYQDNPYLYDLEFSPARVGVKATRPEPLKSSSKPLYSPTTPKNRVYRPCSLCMIKGFQDDHFALSRVCGAAKLSAPDILKIITDNHLCPTCTLTHDPNYKCPTTYKDGRSKICTKGCLHGGSPVHHKACMHNNQAPFVTVAKVDVNKSVPLVEDIQVDEVTLGVQYDTGCQLSLISKSALSALSPSMYSLGTSSQIRMITYAGEGKTILTTAVKLRLPGTTLTLSAIEEDLNNGSGFSFPVPSKWRSLVGSSTSQHSGQVSILLGGDNNFYFPKEIERDSQGLALYQSKLTSNHLIYGPISPNTITWSEPIISSSTKTVSIHSVNTQALQDSPNPVSPTNLGPPTKPALPAYPILPFNSNPPINQASPLKPDPPNNLEPTTEPDPPTHPIPLSSPDPPTNPISPTNPRPITKPDPPTYPIPPFNPDPPINPASPLNPEPQNLGPTTEPDMPIHLTPLSNPDPPTNPGPPTGSDPAATPAFPLKPDPPFVLDPPTNTVPPLNSDPPMNQLYPFLEVEKQLPQETIHGLAEDPVAEDLAPDSSTQHISAQDEFHTDPANPDQ